MEIKNPFTADNFTLKGIWIGIMVLGLMIPVVLINEMIRDRRMRQDEAIADVSQKWAQSQSIIGPVITMPYSEWNNVQKTSIGKKAYLFPDDLDIKVQVHPEIRHRGIYDIIIYTAQIKMKGSFNQDLLKSMALDSTTVDWNDVSLQIGLTDFRGIAEQIKLNWNGSEKIFTTGVIGNDVMAKGVQVNLESIENKQSGKFEIDLQLKGSQNLLFAPVGKTTSVSMQSSWANPSFTGAFLPSQKATISDKGFTADWKIFDLNRNYPQAFKDTKFPIEESSFGVNFILPGDSYIKTDRATKYAFLFIALTFAIYFFIEILQKKRVHSFQYVLVGLALGLFYLLLLSISEYIDFSMAYLIAALAVICMVGLYTKSVFNDTKIASAFTGALGLLYLFIYILIQLQEKALLIGSISLFFLLGFVMYFTRKFNWSELK